MTKSTFVFKVKEKKKKVYYDQFNDEFGSQFNSERKYSDYFVLMIVIGATVLARNFINQSFPFNQLFLLVIPFSFFGILSGIGINYVRKKSQRELFLKKEKIDKNEKVNYTKLARIEYEQDKGLMQLLFFILVVVILMIFFFRITLFLVLLTI